MRNALAAIVLFCVVPGYAVETLQDDGSASSEPGGPPRAQIFRIGNDIVLRWDSQPGQRFEVSRRALFTAASPWTPLTTNWPAGPANKTEYRHTNGLVSGSGFYRLLRHAATNAHAFTFDWNGTNFTYTDAQRSFSGIMLKPGGFGPFPAVIISHGAGGSVSGYSIQKARQMLPWGLVTLAPTLTHTSGGETNPVNMGFCPENLARLAACVDVLCTLADVDTNRIALFGHSMGAFATIGSAASLGGRIRAAAITSGGIIPDSAGATNAAPTVTEASEVRAPLLMVHCDADPVVLPMRSLMLQQLLTSNAVPNERILISSNSIPNAANWHNIQNDANANALVLTNTRVWFQTHGVLP